MTDSSMTILQAILLGIAQGFTEFLPISSSGHLVLIESAMGLDVANLQKFDIAVHIGTLFAILIYFFRDFLNVKMWKFILFASVPAGLIGVFFEDQIASIFRNTFSVGILMTIVGCIFMIPEKQNVDRENTKITYKSALLIGLAQAVAILPGVSRSGSTIITGVHAGLSRQESAKFSFMLGSVAIGGAGLLSLFDIDTAKMPLEQMTAGFIASFCAGMLSITFFMKLLKKYTLKPFGVYLICIGSLATLISL